MTTLAENERLQIAWHLDPVTVGKIKRSAGVCVRAEIALVLPVASFEAYNFLVNGQPFNWHLILALSIGVFSTWAVNTVREWKKGEDLNQFTPSFGAPASTGCA